MRYSKLPFFIRCLQSANMLTQFLNQHILRSLPFTPNEGQKELIGKLCRFLIQPATYPTFVLRGYAGTGKTSMVSALVKSMTHLNRRVILLAPTGRAAKMIAAYSGHRAYTIHKKIYRQLSAGFGRFALDFNPHKHTLFIVDEASMISDVTNFDSPFGTGNLLRDLVSYVFSGEDCRLLFLGDTAQLPPVGQSGAPALDDSKLQTMGLSVSSHLLTEVARQALDSGILANATHIRACLTSGDINLLPTFKLEGYSDICRLNPQRFTETIEQCYATDGIEETVILTRTNRRTNLYNNGIRASILMREEELSTSDRLMVVRNNYFYGQKLKANSEDKPKEEQKQEDDGPVFIANGDLFNLRRLRNVHEMYGLHFAETLLESEDYDDEVEALVCLDTLHTDTPEDNNNLWRELFTKIAEDYPEIRNKKELRDKVMESPYYNALHIRFAYAVTCHKAQGGQWRNVFIDPGMVSDDRLGEDFYRWLYTALTRATQRVWLIGFPD